MSEMSEMERKLTLCCRRAMKVTAARVVASPWAPGRGRVGLAPDPE